MELSESQAARKRMKPDVEEKERDEAEAQIEKEELETNYAGSEEMELNISNIFEKIENFTEKVSELLEAAKTMFKELSNEFEERLIMIHKEQIEKWQEEIKEMRALDASNEEANALLHNAQCLLQHTRID
ncbi:knotted 1-binding protein [Senna tora]|uniref:Knotted 1-binding protein n=1 Tax=Senna tora TaxID=362788 RepID=A0A834WI99_9FABA|nr:knotted 1-binding protein [Senna tora]